MTTAFKTAVDTGSDTQLTKVTLYIGDIGKAWDVQVREIAQGREELGLIPTAEHVVLSWRTGNRKDESRRTVRMSRRSESSRRAECILLIITTV